MSPNRTRTLRTRPPPNGVRNDPPALPHARPKRMRERRHGPTRSVSSGLKR